MATTSSFTSRYNIFLVFAVLFVILAAVDQVVSEPPDIVPPSCDLAHAAGRNLTTVDFCISVLEGYNSAGAASFNDLALISVNLTTTNATATKKKLDGMFPGSEDNFAVFDGLRLCQDQYDIVLRLYQPDCYAAARDSKYAEARSCLAKTVAAVGVCEQWFRERKATSPVAEDDHNLVNLANLASALTMIA